MSGNKRYQEERAKKLEYKYVHDVYSSQALSYDDLCDGPWPEIKNFLFSLRTGSFVADVGCGNGKYLKVRSDIVVHGVDICQELSELAYERHKNIIIANNLSLPYRSSTMDAVISVGVLHHFASFERRLQSVKELARILKPGGQILIYVWAWEQKQRKFSSQDVLIPWTAENAKREGINGCGNHDIQQRDINMRRTHFLGNGCLEHLSVTNNANNVPNFKEKNSNGRVCFDLQSSTKDCSIDVDDCDQLSDNEEQQGNSSLINSINNFTADLKEKLQRLSFSKGKKSPSDDGRKFDESNSNLYYNSQTNCNSNGLAVKRSAVLSANSKQKLDRTEQHKWSYLYDKAILTCNGETANDSKRCNGNDDSSSSPVERFKRFYHVFIKDELSELVQSVRRLKVLTQYYNHGNWVVKAEKIHGPE